MNRNRVTPTQGRPLVEPLEPRLLLDADAEQQALELFSVSPALFVENQGQWADASVRYAFQRAGAGVAFTDQGLAFRLTAATETSAVSADESFDPARPDPWREDRGPGEYQTAAFTVQFERADTVVPVGLAQQETVFNYFVGQQDRWRSAVPTYAAVGYRGLYDGIDLTVSGDGAFLKYAFDVAPGADWGRIAIHYEGVESLSMNDAGDLVIRTAAGDLVDKAPLAYQEAGGQRIVLSAAYRLLDADTVGFALSGTYDPSKELVIDPALIWAQCLGGAGDDSGMAVAVDSAGNVIVTGHTTSTTWEPGGSRGTNHGNSDVFVAKLTSQGLPIWCTYLGGSGDDVPEDMALDSTDNIVLVGATDSGGWISGPFCNSYSGNTDAFVVKLNPRGQHMWSTYLGGSAYDVAHGVTVNPGGEVVIVGETYSSGWVSGGFIPFFAPSYRGRTGFVAGFGADGNNPCSTYTGGADVWRLDCAYDVEFCYAGNGIYIVVGEADLDGPVACVGLFYFAGYGFDVNYPLGWHNASLRSVATAPYWGYRGFYTAGIDQQGQVFVVYSEPWSYGQSYPPLYLAVQGEWPSRIDLAWASSSGNLCLTYTSAEAQLGLQTIVWGLGTDGPAIWCTHRTDLGGKGDEYAGGVAVGRDGTIYVTGGTSSGDWPLGDSGIVYRGGASDAFLAKIGQGVSSGTTTIPGALATVWDYDGKDFKHSAWSLNNGGGVILGGTYWGLGASRPTYRFALPKPSITPGVRELSSITVTIYGKGKGGVFNDTADVWFDNQPLPKRTLRVDEFPNTYTFSGDEARSLLQDAGDGCTSYLDVTIDAVDIMHWYDLRDITVTYTYDGLDSEQLARLDQVVRGRAAILQFKDFHDRFWAGHCVFSAVAKGIAAEGINIVLSLVTGSIPGTWGPLIGALIDHAYGKYVAPHLPDVFYYDLLTGPLDTAIFFVSGGSGYKEGYVSSALETAADRLKDLGNLYISSLSDGILSDNAAELNGAISNAVDAVKRIWKNGDLLGAMNIDYGNNPNETAGEIVKAYVCALSPLLAYNFVLGGGDSGSLVEDNSYLVEYASVLAGQIFNLPPTGVFLSKSSVPEHQPPGTIVGTLSTADPNNGDIDFTYELAGGGADNGKFTISGNTLKTAAEFNYEAKNSYSITAWSTDQGGLSTERPFTVTVTNVNEQPTDINLSGTVVPENQPPGTVVGTLNTVDPDAGDAWTYRLVPDPSGDDNAKFTISGNVLKTAMPFDYETKNLYKIRVESTDLGGLPTEKVFTISVTDVDDTPPVVTGISLNGAVGRGASGIDPSGAPVRTIVIAFNEIVNFTGTCVQANIVTFPGGVEVLGPALLPESVGGSGTSAMTITFASGAVVDTWVKVRISAPNVADGAGNALDGEPAAAGSGRGYIYSAALDLPTGDGLPGGDAVFYVGSLRGDFSGDLAITAADKDGFAAAWRSGSLDADFRGVGFGPRPPDGRITLADINGFTSVYQAGIALGRHLDPLPMSGGGLASEVTPLPPLTAPSAGTDILTQAAGLLPLSRQTAPAVTGPQDTHLVQGDEEPLDLLRLRRLRPVAVIQSAGALVLRL